jgi:predicted transcriptional regulator
MPHTPPRVTDAEWAVLNRLWEQGPATIRELTQAIYPAGGTSEYSTVQKLLERLEAKGCVRRDRSKLAHLFTAKVDRSTVVGQHLQEVADKLCDGSITPLLVHLVQAKRLTTRDRAMLRKLIDEAK